SVPSNTGVYPLCIVPRNSSFYSWKLRSHINAFIQRSGKKFWVQTVGRTHHLSSGSFNNDTVAAVSHHLIGAEFLRACRLNAAVHPVKLQVFFSILLKSQRHMGRGRTAFREITPGKLTGVHRTHTTFSF